MKGKPRSTLFLLGVIIFCIFSFKLILVPVGEAGIRIDDILICVTTLWLVLAGYLRGIKRSHAVRLYGWLIGVGVASALWNGAQGRVPTMYSLTFVLRQAEYMSFYAFGCCLKDRYRQMSQGIALYAGLLMVLVPAQMLRIVPVPGRFDAARPSGNTNGPYELAAVAAFLMCYLGYKQGKVPGASVR